MIFFSIILSVFLLNLGETAAAEASVTFTTKDMSGEVDEELNYYVNFGGDVEDFSYIWWNFNNDGTFDYEREITEEDKQKDDYPKEFLNASFTFSEPGSYETMVRIENESAELSEDVIITNITKKINKNLIVTLKGPSSGKIREWLRFTAKLEMEDAGQELEIKMRDFLWWFDYEEGQEFLQPDKSTSSASSESAVEYNGFKREGKYTIAVIVIDHQTEMKYYGFTNITIEKTIEKDKGENSEAIGIPNFGHLLILIIVVVAAVVIIFRTQKKEKSDSALIPSSQITPSESAIKIDSFKSPSLPTPEVPPASSLPKSSLAYQFPDNSTYFLTRYLKQSGVSPEGVLSHPEMFRQGFENDINKTTDPTNLFFFYLAAKQLSYISAPQNQWLTDMFHNYREKFKFNTYFEIPKSPSWILEEWALSENMKGNVHLDGNRKEIVDAILGANSDENFVIIGESGACKTALLFEIFDCLTRRENAAVLTDENIGTFHEDQKIRLFYAGIPEDQKLVNAIVSKGIKGLIVSARENDWKQLPLEFQQMFKRMTICSISKENMKVVV